MRRIVTAPRPATGARSRGAVTSRARALAVLMPVALAGLLVACNDDGRYLRPARPDQVTTISTTTPPSTTSTGAIFDGIDPGSGVAGGGVLPGDSLPGAEQSTAEPGDGASLVATAPWRDGSAIDPRYSCEGANISPALFWPVAPAGTREIAITMTDEQNPSFVHWAISGLDAGATGIAEGDVPIGAVQSTNGGGTIGYTGPCPPSGTTHTYRLTVHYLAGQTELGDGANADDMMVAIDAGTLQIAEVTGTFTRA